MEAVAANSVGEIDPPGAFASVLEAALAYILRGWAVIPIKARTKRPACPQGKNDASKDPEQIRAWFDGKPDLNIGIVTGRTSLLAVVDIDPRNGGDESLARLQKDFDLLPPTCTVATGGGGRHLYFEINNAQATALTDHTNLAGYSGVDFKCDGYVVAPPSIHESGENYRWESTTTGPSK